MDWSQVLTIAGANIAMFLWSVRQSNTFYMHLDRKMDDNRKESNNLISAIKQDVLAIHEEMKDFHDRLFKLEQGRK